MKPAIAFPDVLMWTTRKHKGIDYSSAWIAFVKGEHGKPAKVASWIEVKGDKHAEQARFIGHACNAYPRAIELLSHCAEHAGIGNPLKASIQAFLREIGE